MSDHHKKASADLRYRLAAVFCSLIYGIIVSRALGAEGRGGFVLQTLLVQGLCLTFLNAGLGVALQTVCARHKTAARVCHRFAVLVSMILAVLASVGYLILYFRSGEPASGLMMFLICLGFFSTLYQCFAAGMLNGLGEVVRRARLEFAQTVGLLIVAIVLILAGQRTVIAHAIGFYGVLFFSSIQYFRFLYNAHNGKLQGRLRSKNVTELLKYGARVYAGEVAASSRFQLDQLIITSWFGAAGLGLYQQAQALARRGLLPSQSYATSTWQPLARATASQSQQIVFATWWKVIKLSAIVLVAGWFMAPIIPIIYGEDFREAIPLFRLLLPGILLQGSVQVIAVYLFSHLHKPGVVAVLNWASLFLQIGLMVLGYSVSSTLAGVAIGAGVSWVLTALLFWGAYRLYSRQEIGFTKPAKRFDA